MHPRCPVLVLRPDGLLLGAEGLREGDEPVVLRWTPATGEIAARLSSANESDVPPVSQVFAHEGVKSIL